VIGDITHFRLLPRKNFLEKIVTVAKPDVGKLGSRDIASPEIIKGAVAQI
jgi:hypothetical protein